MDSTGKTDEKPAISNAQHQQPSFLSEMKVVLGKQARSEDAQDSEGIIKNYLTRALWTIMMF